MVIFSPNLHCFHNHSNLSIVSMRWWYTVYCWVKTRVLTKYSKKTFRNSSHKTLTDQQSEQNDCYNTNFRQIQATHGSNARPGGQTGCIHRR